MISSTELTYRELDGSFDEGLGAMQDGVFTWRASNAAIHVLCTATATAVHCPFQVITYRVRFFLQLATASAAHNTYLSPAAATISLSCHGGSSP
jgi:hypothetical protein